MHTVKTPLAALLLVAVLSSLVAGCGGQSPDGIYSGPAEQNYEAPPPRPSEDKES
ncbi:MAG: hypothetical protein KJ622_13010 [Alphaproteobacteria bacterium]|nr:hypothetical protein [Alphaproteobacteria bacterium]